MPRGIPKAKSPTPRLGIAKLEAKVDKLIQANAALIAALTELVTKVNHPVMVTGNEVADLRPGPMKPPQYGAPGDVVARSSASGAEAWGTYQREITKQQTAAAEDDPNADPVQAMYDELASYAEEDETPPPPPDEAELWSKRLNRWRGQKLWMPAWGPRPGQDGCQVPPYLMGNGQASR